jgi:hypothetical protein
MNTQFQCPTCKLVLKGEANPRTVAENAYVQLLAHFRNVHAGTGHTCGRRIEGFGFADDVPDSDFFRSDDNTCSYCGSISAEEFFKRVDAGEEITPTDKSYKAYIGNDNTKFYFQHLSDGDKRLFIEYLNNHRFDIAVPGYFYTRPYFISYAKPKTQ